MTPKQIGLVRQTSDILLSVHQPVADRFYVSLFELLPEARPFFRPDLASQKEKLTSMVASLIGMLGRPEMFASIVRRAGQDHARLGILPRHYAPAGLAFLGAVEAALGPRFTPDVGEAWQALYAAIAACMIEAAA